MRVVETALSGVNVYFPKRIGDERGYFSEWYNARDLSAAGLDQRFVQDNVVLSREPGTVRGLHFQTPPHAQGKLVGVLRGAAFDVVVDIRAGSPSYGRSVSVELSAELGSEIFVPAGFAHGICNRVADTLVGYKVTDYYSADCDKGLAWDDPELGIAWPAVGGAAKLSERDRRWPRLRDLGPSPFRYEGSR